MRQLECFTPTHARLTHVNMKGWLFWRVRDSSGKEKGFLGEFRQKITPKDNGRGGAGVR